MIADPVAKILVRQKPWIRVGSVLFGAVLIHLSLGTYHTFGNMLPYMASYMRNHTDPSVRIEQLIWIPTFQGCFPFAMVIGGILSEKLGPRLTTALGCYIMAAGVFLSYYTIKISYYLFVFTYGMMFGLGQGIAYVVAVSCVINWDPSRVGLLSGIVAGGFGVSSAIFAPIQTELINPENKAASSDGYFSDAALIERVPGIFIKLSIVYVFMQTIGLIFICDPPAEYVRKYLSNTAIIDMAWLSKRRTRWLSRSSTRETAFSGYSYSQLASEERDNPKRPSGSRQRRSNSCESDTKVIIEGDSDSEDNEPEAQQPQQVSLPPSEVLKSSTFYCLFISLFCCSFYGNLWYNLYKTFGETFIQDDMFFALAFSVGTVANAGARIGWGFLTDKTSFQTSLSVATCMATALLLTIPMTALFGKAMYLLWLTLTFICLAATHSLFITATVRCFGSEHKATNYGLLILSTTLSGVVLAMGTETLLTKIGYNWLFIFSAIFPFMAFLITSSIKVTPQGHLII